MVGVEGLALLKFGNGFGGKARVDCPFVVQVWGYS